MAKPKIRFNGYTEDWEQRKLGDLTKELSDYATMASGLPLLTSSRSGLMYQSDFRDRKTTTSDETLFSIVPKGSCTYRHMSDDDIFHLNINVLEKGLVSREYPVFISSEDNDLEFIIQHINSSDRFRGFCKGQKKGGTRTRLYYKTLCEFEMMTPLIEEQKKISATLHNLDHLITLHQRKCEQTKTLKKYMLQKMFPQDGEKVPQIRFEGFTEDWEQRKFGELYEKVNEKNDLSFGADKIISVANMYFKEEVKESNDDYMRTYNVMRLGDIAFEGNKSKNFSHGRFVENTIGDGIVSHVFDVFRPVMNYDLLFWKYLINNENVMGRIMTRCTKASTMMTNLVAKDFLNEDILIPTIEEQSKIGECIDKIDHLITLHQRKCDELKEVKKFMLQNMFV